MTNWNKFTQAQPEPNQAIITRQFIAFMNDYSYSCWNPALSDCPATRNDSIEWAYVPAEKSFSSADIVRVGVNSYINGAQHCSQFMDQREYLQHQKNFQAMLDRYQKVLEEQEATK